MIDPQAQAPVVQVIAYGPDGIVETPIHDPDRIGDVVYKHPVTWVNVDGLGDVRTLEQIGAIFHLHPLALEDIVNVHQRPKMEPYGEHHFIVARMPVPGKHFDTEQLSMFLGTDFVLTFQDRPGDCLQPLRERLRKAGTRLRGTGPDFLAYALLDTVMG